MANLDAIREALNLIYLPDLAVAIKRNVVLLNLLPIIDGGRNATCTWPVKFSARDAAVYDDGSDAVSGDFTTEQRTQASLPWARLKGFAHVDGLAEAVAAANASGAVGLGVDPVLLMEELEDAAHTMAQRLSADLYAGNPAATPPQISGATTMVAGDVYATIDKTSLADATEWEAADETLSRAAGVNLASIRANLHRPFKDACGYFPEFVTCNGAVFDEIATAFDTDIQYNLDIQTERNGTVNLKRAGGFRAIEVDGVPYIEDRFCPDDTLHAWHTSSTQIVHFPKPSTGVMAEDVRDAMFRLTGEDLYVAEIESALRAAGAGTLAPKIIKLAKNGDSTRAQLVLYCQVRHRFRNRHGRLTLVP